MFEKMERECGIRTPFLPEPVHVISQSSSGHHWQHWRWSSVQQGSSQFRGSYRAVSPSHSLPHQWKEGLSFPSGCGELVKPEAGRTRERVPGRIDGRLRDIIVQVEVCPLQDENIKLCIDKIDCEEIKSVDHENMDIKRKIWEAIHIRCKCPTLNSGWGYEPLMSFDHCAVLN